MVAGADLRLLADCRVKEFRAITEMEPLQTARQPGLFTIIKSTVAYRVAVSFRAAPLAAHCYRAEYGTMWKTKKPLMKPR